MGILNYKNKCGNKNYQKNLKNTDYYHYKETLKFFKGQINFGGMSNTDWPLFSLYLTSAIYKIAKYDPRKKPNFVYHGLSGVKIDLKKIN